MGGMFYRLSGMFLASKTKCVLRAGREKTGFLGDWLVRNGPVAAYFYFLDWMRGRPFHEKSRC